MRFIILSLLVLAACSKEVQPPAPAETKFSVQGKDILVEANKK